MREPRKDSKRLADIYSENDGGRAFASSPICGLSAQGAMKPKTN
jgi:hypothetical protein